MSETIKRFQTLDNNSKIFLIIHNGELPHVLKKSMFMFAEYHNCDKSEMKDSKKCLGGIFA